MKILPFQKGFSVLRNGFKHFQEKESQRQNDKRNILNDVILESLNENEREKEQILNSLVEQVSYLDPQYRIKWVNEAGLRRISSETSIEEILGEPCYKVWHGRNKPCKSCPVTTTLKTGWPWKEEIEYSDGTTKLVSAQPVKDDNGNLKGVIEIELDITMRKEAELALEKSRQRAGAILDAIPDFLFVFNNHGFFIDYHPAADFDIITDTNNPEGRYLNEVLPYSLAEAVLKQSETLTDIGSVRNFEYNDQSFDANVFYDCRLVKTNSDENVCIIKDISSQRIREKDILYRSFHDSLTGLYNRAYFEEELNRIEQSRQILPVSVLIIDVNGLKLTNDAFGHDYGDKLLQKVADILRSNCRKGDVIARTGGDEFSIILPNSPISKAEKLSGRIRQACRTSSYDDIFARPSVSVGCAEKNNNAADLREIVKNADEKMYREKLSLRSEHHKVFINDILESIKKRDLERKEHVENCLMLAVDFAKNCNMSSDSIEKIRKLAIYHDIGKIRVSENVLKQPRKLTDEEFTIVKQHPIIGYRIAKTIPDYIDISELILYHHERWDGTGYPSGLKNKDIPLVCRLFSIVESFELILNGSVYREGRPVSEAVEELRKNSGKQFEPDLTERFIEMVINRETYSASISG